MNSTFEAHLVRHGQTVNNVARVLNTIDDTLTPDGEIQAIELGKKLKQSGHTYDIVLTSPLPRAEHSTRLIMQELGLRHYSVVEDLQERLFGEMTGVSYSLIKTMEDILEVHGGITYFLSGGGAETFADLFERAKRVVSEIKEKYAGKKVLIVAHGDIGKMMYAAFYELDWKQTLMMFHFKNADAIVLTEGFDPSQVYLFKEG